MKKRIMLIIGLLVISLTMIACNKEPVVQGEIKKETGEAKDETGDTKDDYDKRTDNQAVEDFDEKENEIYQAIVKFADEVKDNGDSITFRDDSGRDEITIKKNPESVTVLFASYAAMYKELGGKINGLVGGKLAKEVYKFQLGKDITEESKIVVDSSAAKKWDLEKIIETKPDLIIAAISSNGYQTAQKLGDELGASVIGINYSGIREYIKWAKVFSLLNDREDLFESVALKAAKECAKLIAEVPEDKTIKAISLFPSSKGVRANRNSSDLGAMLMDLGVDNVLEDNVDKEKGTRYEIGVEDIYSVNPEMIFIQCPSSEEFAREIVDKYCASDPLWQEIDAVKNGKVFFLPRGLFHNRPNGKYGESYQILFDHLYGGK